MASRWAKLPRQVEIPELKQASLVGWAEDYRDHLFSQLEKVKKLLLS